MHADRKDESSVKECRTNHVVDDVYDCLINSPRCRYAKVYGDCIFCIHPKRKEFSRRPIATQS